MTEKPWELLSSITFLYRTDIQSKQNPGPHLAGGKKFHLHLTSDGTERLGNVYDHQKIVQMVKGDLEFFKARFERQVPFKYVSSGLTINPKEVESIHYKLLKRLGNKELTEIGSVQWNRLEGRWRASA